MTRALRPLLLLVPLFFGVSAVPGATVQLLNVSYDPTREFYQQLNAAFSQAYQAKTGKKVEVQQSHGGSAKQARSVIDGLAADVVTLGLAAGVDALHEHGGLVAADWRRTAFRITRSRTRRRSRFWSVRVTPKRL